MHEALLRRIQQAVLNECYRFSEHALDELDDDRLHYVDAESAILTGNIVRIQPAEPGKTERYTVRGLGTDLSTEIGVVCRFDNATQLLIITVYEVFDE